MPSGVRINGKPVQTGPRIIRENVKEYQNERRAKELSRRGYDPGQISAMMQIPVHHVEKMKRHSVDSKEMKVDGKL